MDSKIEFGRSISLVYHNYRRFVADKLSAVDNFTPGWVPYLKIMSNNAGMVSEDLSKKMMVSKPAIAKTIRQLELEGLCFIKNHPTDRRSKQLYLTDKAEVLLDRINPLLKDLQEEVLVGLSKEEIEILDKVFVKILNNITK